MADQQVSNTVAMARPPPTTVMVSMIPRFRRLVVGARTNDEIAEILTIDADGDLHTG